MPDSARLGAGRHLPFLWLGLRPTLVLAAAGELLAALWLLASPLRALRQAPAAEPERLRR